MKVECTKCGKKHEESTRVKVRRAGDLEAYDLCCPKCLGRNFYQLDENGMRARSGLQGKPHA